MRNPLLLVVGAIMVLLGVVFGLQGIDVLKGSGMSGKPFWAVAGPVLALAGGALIYRSRKPA